MCTGHAVYWFHPFAQPQRGSRRGGRALYLQRDMFNLGHVFFLPRYEFTKDINLVFVPLSTHIFVLGHFNVSSGHVMTYVASTYFTPARHTCHCSHSYLLSKNAQNDADPLKNARPPRGGCGGDRSEPTHRRPDTGKTHSENFPFARHRHTWERSRRSPVLSSQNFPPLLSLSSACRCCHRCVWQTFNLDDQIWCKQAVGNRNVSHTELETTEFSACFPN